MWNFLNVAAIEVVHADLIDTYGGSHGLGDAGLLESAVLRAENKAHFDPEATTATLAASVSYGLTKNHAFIDGNKRIGLAARVDFLKIDFSKDQWLQDDASADEQIAAVKRVAASEMTEDEWTAWVEGNVGRIAG